MYRVKTATKKELEPSLNRWNKQSCSLSTSIAVTSRNILWDIVHPEEPRFDTEFRDSLRKVNKVKVIKRGNALLGVIEYGYDKKTKSLWIHNLSASPNIVAKRTYKGIGTTLLLYAIKYAIKAGAKKICLYSMRDNFYKKFGFLKIAGMMILRLCKKIIRKLFAGA